MEDEQKSSVPSVQLHMHFDRTRPADLVGIGSLHERNELSVLFGCASLLPHRAGYVQSVSPNTIYTLPEQAEVSKSLCADEKNKTEPPLVECKERQSTNGNSEMLLKNGNSEPLIKNGKSEVLRNNIGITVGDTKLLVQKIKEAVAENNERIHKDRLKKRFKSVWRPILAPRLLILPEAMKSPSTRFLYNQHYLKTDRVPHYLSASEIMMHEERTVDPEEWDNFVNQIIRLRVFVVEDWELSIGNIEKCYYFYGIHGAGDSEFYKGEIDASYHKGEGGCPGKATISAVLWKGKEIIYAEVFKDLVCDTIQAAEACAALALCFKCIELGILDLLLWTDSMDIDGAISGSLTVRADRVDRDLLLLLRNISTRFNRFISMCKRREQLFLADDIAQSFGKSNKPMLLNDLLDKWDYELRGKASYRISQSSQAAQTIKSFAENKKGNAAEKIEPYTGKAQTKCFVEVNNISKLDVVSLLKETLCPTAIYFAVSRLEEMPADFTSQLATITGVTLASKTVIGDCSLLKFGNKDSRGLLIVLDPTIPEELHNHFGLFTIILVDPEERKCLDPSIEEASALTYVYFNGVLTDQDAEQKRQQRNKGMQGKHNGMRGSSQGQGKKQQRNKGMQGKSNGMRGSSQAQGKKGEGKKG